MKNIKLLTGILGILFLAGCGGETPFRETGGFVWNTEYHIIYQGPKELEDSILLVFSDVENSVSMFKEGSTVAKINSNESNRFDTHFRRVYESSRKFNSISGGVFDPTLAPLIGAWGFGKGHSATQDTLRLDSLLQFVGITKTRIEGERFLKDNPGIEFNFSALAKGYGVDCVADMFRRNGIDNFLIEVGGEIMTSGQNREGKNWVIAVDKPAKGNNSPGRDVIETLSLTNMGVATSGNYRNYHSSGGGGSYGHTISPITGRPVESDVISATVLAPTAMEADALATASMACGSKKAMEMCDSLGYGLMVVLPDFSTLSNKIFNSYITEKR